jgi:mannuronan synthase
MKNLAGHGLYLSVMALLVLSIPGHAMGDVSRGLIVVGVIGSWRYGWAILNFLRALYYIKLRYPHLRDRAGRTYAAQSMRAHAYFLVTSYKIASEVTVPVYQSIFRAAAASQGGATVVASVVDSADARLITQIFDGMGGDMTRVRLFVDQIAGTGKRDALARSFRLIAREAPTRHDVLVVVDGDSAVPEDLIARTAPFFLDPGIGALTTDEHALIKEGGLFRTWFDLRFAQRQVMMSSMGLSGRVLTLTGRMSVFRADLATHGDFIDMVQSDHIDHWRLGRVKFLTGDDKSTWFWLLRHGYRMAYLPDVTSVSMESQPDPSFVKSAVTLMIRWYGNMLRTNGRALLLSPFRIGFFTWWSILDQRVGIWTTLAGPISVIAGAITVSPAVLPAYIAWVMGSRYVFAAILSLVRRQSFPIAFPILLYFGQIVGAAVKSFVLFRLDRQRWTRQSVAASRKTATRTQRLRGLSSAYVHILALGWLTFAVFFVSGAL